MKDREIRSQDTMPWSISSRKAVRVKANISPKLQRTRQPLLPQQTELQDEAHAEEPGTETRSLSNSLGAALHQARERPDALHVDELCGEGRVCRQLGQLFQGLQSSVDAVGLDPLQELTGSPSLSEEKETHNWDEPMRRFSPNCETFQCFGDVTHDLYLKVHLVNVYRGEKKKKKINTLFKKKN